MNSIAIEYNQQECRVTIHVQLTTVNMREDTIQVPIGENLEDEGSIQITVPEMSMQYITSARIVVPVQETNKLASGEIVLPKIS